MDLLDQCLFKATVSQEDASWVPFAYGGWGLGSCQTDNWMKETLAAPEMGLVDAAQGGIGMLNRIRKNGGLALLDTLK